MTAYLDRPVEGRVNANLKKAGTLFEKAEFSSSVLRSVIAAEVLVNDLTLKALKRKTNHSFAKNFLRKASLPEKLTWCFEALYGFSVSKKYPKTFAGLMQSVEKRNLIAHQGVFANREDAIRAYEAATKLIKKLSRRLGINTRDLKKVLELHIS